MRTSSIPCLLVVLAAGSARASVVYDAITGNNTAIGLFFETEFADDATLSTGAGTTIRQVEIGALANGAYSGAMTVRLWSDAGGRPGSLLGQSTVPLTLTDTLPHIIAAQFTGVVATTPTIWTGVQFTRPGSPEAGWMAGSVQPTVGTTTDRYAEHEPDGSWLVAEGPNTPNWLRIDTVPAPGPLAAMGLVGVGGVLVRRR